MFSQLLRKISGQNRTRPIRSLGRKRLVVETLEKREMLSAVEWSVGPSLPAPRTDAVAVVAPDNSLIVLAGSTSGDPRNVPKLATDATGWISAPDLDFERVGHGAVRLGGAGTLVYGGFDGNEASEEILNYDFYFGDSQDGAKMSLARAEFGAAADALDRAYAIGGLDKEGAVVLSSAERYDATADQWSAIADLPAVRHSSATVSDGAGHIFLFGGSSTAAAGAIETTSYRYTIATGTWDTVAPMPVGTQDSAAVIDDDGIVYVLGGIADTGTIATVQTYDPATDTWGTETDLPAATHSLAAAIDANERLVVIGGTDATGNVVDTVYLSQRFDIPESVPNVFSTPITSGSLDEFYSYNVNAFGNPDPTYSLVTAPVGMTIDLLSGQISWQPVAGQVGDQAVTVRAENSLGSDDQSFVINVLADTTPPTAPTNLTFDSSGTTTVVLSWTAATDNNGVDHYEVLQGRRCGWRGRNTCYSVIQTDIASTSTTVTDLAELSTFKLVVRAVDAEGNSSWNSNRVIATTQGAPVLRYYANGRINGPLSTTANSPFGLQLAASANPAPTYSLVSGPTTMTVDPVTGQMQWTPTASDAGLVTVTVAATNSVGSTQLDIPITVAADIPIVTYQFNPNSGGDRYALAETPFEIQLSDLSNTLSTFELVDAPVGMTIDTNTGLIQWAPTVADAGQQTIIVRATNSAGSTDRTIPFEIFFTDRASNLQVTNLDQLEPTLSWTAPTGTGVSEIAGYSIDLTARYRRGRSRRTERIHFDSPGTGTSLDLDGLTIGRNYKVVINAYDVAGNRGLFSNEVLEFASRPALPTVSWTVRDVNGGTSIIANQPVVIQLNDSNPDPSTIALIDAPAGLTLNASTGIANWTPTASQVGSFTATFRFTNSVGPRDVTVPIRVSFSGAVTGAIALRMGTGNTASVSWTAPADNVEPIAEYRVTLHWRWSGRRRSRSFIVSGGTTSVDVSLIPTGAVWHRGVSITSISESGLNGISSGLIPYVG